MIVLLDTNTGELLQRWTAKPAQVPCPGTQSVHTRIGELPEYLPDGTDRYALVEATVNNANIDPKRHKLGAELVTVDGLSVTISRKAVALSVGDKNAIIDAELSESDRAMARVAEDAMQAFDNLVDDLVSAGVLTVGQANATKAKVPASVRTKIDARRSLRASKP